MYFLLLEIKRCFETFCDFIVLDPARIRIRIHQICWIRIRIRSMRIHIPVLNILKVCSAFYFKVCAIPNNLWNLYIIAELPAVWQLALNYKNTFLRILNLILDIPKSLHIQQDFWSIPNQKRDFSITLHFKKKKHIFLHNIKISTIKGEINH